MNCRCDEELAFTLTRLFTSGFTNDQFLTLNDGFGFNHAGQCHVEFATTTTATKTTTFPDNEDQTNSGNGGNGGSNEGSIGGLAEEERHCCGTYPNRAEFFSHGGLKSCCGEYTYNTKIHDCCTGGFLGAIGSCAAQ